MPVTGGGGGPILELGLFASTTTSALFVRADLSYNPDIDPRLPKHTELASDINTDANVGPVSTEAILADVTHVAVPGEGQLGYLRIGADVWSYSNVFVANSTVTGIANVQVRTEDNPVTGTIVSVLGTR